MLFQVQAKQMFTCSKNVTDILFVLTLKMVALSLNSFCWKELAKLCKFIFGKGELIYIFFCVGKTLSRHLVHFVSHYFDIIIIIKLLLWINKLPLPLSPNQNNWFTNTCLMLKNMFTSITLLNKLMVMQQLCKLILWYFSLCYLFSNCVIQLYNSRINGSCDFDFIKEE